MSHQLCRRRMAPELEAFAFDRRKCRKAAFDSEGRDVRLITFGMKWQMIRERKEETLTDFTARVQKAFDEAYEKITGGKRTSLDSHLLPTIKTPAIRKTRPRLIQEEEKVEGAGQGVEPGPTITVLAFEDVSPTNATVTEQMQEPVETAATTVRRSARTRARTAQVATTGKKSLEDFTEESVRRSTRARRAKGRTQTEKEEETVPTTTSKRATRARTGQQDKEEEVEAGREDRAEEDASSKTDGTNPAPASQDVEKESRQSPRIISQVLVERLSTSLLPSPTSDPSQSPTAREEDGRNVACEAILPCPGSPAEITQVLSQRSVLEAKRWSRSTASMYPDTSDSESEAYMKPPPPKRSLRLKKKVGRPRKGRGGKKGGPQAISSASVLQEETTVETRTVEEGVAAEPHDCDLVTSEVGVGVEKEQVSGEQQESVDDEELRTLTEPTEVTKKDAIPPTNSAESMYESCVSEMGSSSPQTRQTTSPSSPSTLTPPQCPPQPSTNTTATVTKPSRAPTTHSSTPVTPADEPKAKPPAAGSATVTKTPKIRIKKTPLGDTSTKDHPVLSPLSVPYLHETPRCLQQLQGGHRPGGSPHSGKVISISELRASHSRIPTPKTITKPHPLQQRTTPRKLPRAGAKRLRSVSLEKLPANPSQPKKDLVVVASSSGEEEGGEEFQSPLPASSSDDVETDETQDEGGFSSTEKTSSDPESADNHGEGGTATKSKSSSKAAAFWQLLQKKGGEGVVSKLAFVNVNANLPSFLPRNSPRKQDTFESRQVKLAEKMQRKNEEEEKRRREMEQKRQQDLAEKIRKREERLKRVAEKQAALQREEVEKKKRAQGLKSRDDELTKQRIIQKKVKEMEERNRRAKERKEAVDNRRKQEEEQRLKRFHQIEEERRMAEELLRKRQEQEEEEKRVRRQEKQKLDLERQAELERQEQEQRKKREEEAERLRAEDTRLLQSDEDSRPKKEHDKTRFEKLLVSQQKGTGANRFVQQWKQLKATPGKNTAAAPKNKGTVTKSKPASRFSPVNDGGAHGPSPMDIHATTAGTVVKSKTISSQKALNSTITIDNVGYQTPVKKPNSKYTTAPSYEMTPAEVQDPLLAYSNYDITELSDDDSTDDEDQPKKPVPMWAHPHILNNWMVLQEDHQKFDVAQIFPPDQLLQMPDLAKIFKVKRRRFYHRSSSAQWDSPMLKKSRHECYL